MQSAILAAESTASPLPEAVAFVIEQLAKMDDEERRIIAGKIRLLFNTVVYRTVADWETNVVRNCPQFAASSGRSQFVQRVARINASKDMRRLLLDAIRPKTEQ